MPKPIIIGLSVIAILLSLTGFALFRFSVIKRDDGELVRLDRLTGSVELIGPLERT
jgi:hypothetical protein